MRPRRPNHTSVAVIGGGFGGIAAAVNLQRRGIEDFVIFERSEGPGGTWWDNRYPGAETDAPAHLYCFSFAPFDWTRTHVRRPELQAYVDHLVERFRLLPHFRFATSITTVAWDEQGQGYVLTTDSGEQHRFDAVISAVGMFSAPRLPHVPGLDAFRGAKLHTASWDHSVDLRDQRVAVMGTGSSAAQVVPTVAGEAHQVYVFQRQPGWLLPKGDRDLTATERALFRVPGLWRLNRLRLYLKQERREVRGAFFRPGTRSNGRARDTALRHIETVFAARPDLQAAVTPRYPFGGKRAILSSQFFEALVRDDVELIPHALAACTETTVIDTAGVEREVDALVMATGFHAASYLSTLEIVGRDGVRLHDVWAGEPYAFLGLTVPRFPNFFMLYGPNTNGGLIMFNLERQSEYAAREIARLRGRVSSVEVRDDVTRTYNTWLQAKIARTSFTSTDNYYTSASGKVVTQWPDCETLYAVLTRVLRRVSTLGRRTRRPRENGPEDRVGSGAAAVQTVGS